MSCHFGSFGWALYMMEKGESVRLGFWSEEVHISLQEPDENSKMTAPYLYVTSRYGRIPWNPTQIEILTKAWELYHGE